MMDWVLKWKKLFNWIWIEILVIAIFKKIKQNFLCLWTIKTHFLFNMQSNNTYLTKWRVPHNFFVDTNTSWIYLAICFYTKPGEEMILSLFHIEEEEEGRERERGTRPTSSSSKTYFCCLSLCYVFQCYVNETRVHFVMCCNVMWMKHEFLVVLSWYLYDAKSKGDGFSQNKPISLEQYFILNPRRNY